MRTSRPTLLIDGDLLLYRAAAACEQETHWGRQVWTMSTNLDEVKAVSTKLVKEWRKELGGDRVLVCLSDPARNFRKELNPHYKENRKGVRKPMGWPKLMEWVRSKDCPWEHLERPGLEADDCIGIMMTRPRANVIGVSDDKDFLCIPGRFYRVGMGSRGPQLFESSVEEADRFFYAQAMAGDPVDGFSGAPGIGFDTAMELLSEGVGFELYEHVLKSGKRKGQTETRKRKVPMEEPWDIVQSAYTLAGLTEETALLNARMARTLRWEAYDREKREPILWTPPTS